MPKPKPFTDEQRRDIAAVGECLTSPAGTVFLAWLRRRYFDRFVPATDHDTLVVANAQRGVVADILAHLDAFNRPQPTTTKPED